MSKQGGKGGAAKGRKPQKPGADEKREDVLQAVVIADSFQDRFKPFTLNTPRVRPLLSTGHGYIYIYIYIYIYVYIYVCVCVYVSV